MFPPPPPEPEPSPAKAIIIITTIMTQESYVNEHELGLYMIKRKIEGLKI
jgi:hypothetical protein